jgi:hypothetical protein
MFRLGQRYPLARSHAQIFRCAEVFLEERNDEAQR